MGFKEMKEKALNYSAQKLWASSLTLHSNVELETFISKSENKKFTNKETWVEKTFKKRIIVIFLEEWSEFFKDIVTTLPLLLTKSFSQNTPIKLILSNTKELDLNKYSVKEIPSLIVFENKQTLKTISWEENILKLVKNFDLDINKQIDNIK